MKKLAHYLFASLAFTLFIASGSLAEDGSLARNCQGIREQGHLPVGHYVVYHTVKNKTDAATMVYCDEKDGMQSLKEEAGTKQKYVATNCKDLQDQGMTHNGYSIIYPFLDHPESPVLVFCDQTTQGGGWTAINRRDEHYDEPIDFQRTFEEYAAGFGDINFDFYIGNEIVHSLTDATMNELWVDIEDIDGVTGYAHYQFFHVGPRDAHELFEPPYQMVCSFYEGTIGEGLGYHNGMGFTTFDSDNDEDSCNCAEVCGSGWWYKHCATSNLNGLYGDGYFRWWVTKDHKYILSKAQMMVRPLST
ncbi:unnamed protein product [Meganyctiphanes norvegica]|uniref:Fibrinogen C-terminal domain-containing protein n=1 Tax=Meganyctiphanes norvegica TaxID=48144 RepID=A0AAV2QVV5_MEGNR